MGAYITEYSKHKGGINKYIEENHPKRIKFRSYRSKWNSLDIKNKNTVLLFLLLETVSICNLKCPMCIHSVGRKHIDNMSNDMFNLILDAIREMQVPSVCVNCTNEPLLDKDIISRINKIAALDCVVDIFMNTNGTLLTKKKSEELLNSGLTRLLIGFDGFSKEVYEQIRVGAKYREVISNILKLVELKKKMNKPLPIVRISLVRLAANEKEIGKWLKFWKNKVDQVCIQEYVTPVLDNSRDYLIAASNLRKNFSKEAEICPEPFQRAVITGNGDVLPCCSHQSTAMPIGNIRNEDLKGIWYGRRASDLREFFIRKKWHKHPICAKCIDISSGLYTEKAILK